MSEPVLSDRMRSWLTLANFRRNRAAIEGVTSAIYFALLVYPAATGGGVLGIVSLILLASTIVLYWRAPFLALSLAAVGEISLLASGFATFGGPAPFLALLPLMLVFFGAAAYGNAGTRWSALPGTLPAALGVFGAATWQLNIDVTFGFSYANVAMVLFLFLLAVLVLSWLGGYLLRTQRARQSAEVGKSVATAQLGAAQQEVTLEQERNRVARDVHDIVAHSLAVVIAQADGARYASKDAPPAVTEALENIAATARGALTDVRVLLGELRHNQEAGPQPGVDDLEGLLRGFRESGLDVRSSSYGEAVPVSEAVSLAVYRIVQESLTNALRHGERGAPVDLELDWGASVLTLTVTNDVPSGASAVGNPTGHGLPGMRERATLAGGEFHAGGGTSGRFRVRASLPIDRAAAASTPSIPAEA